MSLRDARTSLSLPKMMAVMLGEWEEAVASITMAVAVTTVEVVIKAVEVATATVDVAAVAATTVVVVKATEVAAIRLEAAEEEATAEVVAVATITIEALEEMTEAITTTAMLLVVASTMAHLAGADLKQLLKETISRTMAATTTEVATCLEVVDSEVLMALLSSLVDLETEVVALPTVAEAEEVTVVDSVETLATMRALLSPLPRVSLTTLLLHTTMVASREVETPVVLPAHRAASTNRRAPLRVLPPRVTLTNRDPKLAAESLVPYTLATLIRTQLTLLFLSSLATRA